MVTAIAGMARGAVGYGRRRGRQRFESANGSVRIARRLGPEWDLQRSIRTRGIDSRRRLAGGAIPAAFARRSFRGGLAGRPASFDEGVARVTRSQIQGEDILGILWSRSGSFLRRSSSARPAPIVVAKRMPNLYKSETLILVVPQRVPESYVRSTVSGASRIACSRCSNRSSAAAASNASSSTSILYREQRRTQPLEVVIEAMRSSIKVETVRGGEAFSVNYVSRDPNIAKEVTERLASLFIEENVRESRDAGDRHQRFSFRRNSMTRDGD
jgi:uncharacterized protein involved in exopolysaccharide biosynthesis